MVIHLFDSVIHMTHMIDMIDTHMIDYSLCVLTI